MNLNPIDFNYQDGLNRFPIQDYIDENISVSDNNSSNYSSNLTAILRNDVKKLIGEETENITVPAPATLKHTYIYNSNLSGEIRFWSFGWYSINNYNPTPHPNHLVKIDIDGKLKLYYIYNPLINLILGSGWIDVVDSISGLLASDNNISLTIVTLQAEILLLQNKITDINKENAQQLLGLGAFDDLEDAATSANFESYLSHVNNAGRYTTTGYLGEYNSLYGQITGYIQTRSTQFLTGALNNVAVLINDNPVVASYLGLGGIAFGFACSAINNQAYLQEVARQLNSNITLSSNINNTIKNELHTSNNQKRVLEITYYCSNISNLVRAQGFINSNIVTPQLIPNINNYTFTYNGVELSTKLNDYLLKAGGTMTGRINFNYGANVGVPVAGSGGSGERINLNINGITINDYAASIGVSANSLWMSAPNNQNYQWYVNGIERMSLTSNGVLNTSTLQQGGVNVTTISSNIVINQTPNVQKKFMFTGTCSSSMLMPDGITYFAYDIDLRNYTQLKYAPNPNTPYRIFKIKVFFGSVYFGYLTNTKPNVLSYEVYMSNESQAGGGGIGSVGLNVCALGYPENVILNSISPTQLSLVCGDFNFVTVLSRVNGSVFNAIIEDCLF